MAIHVCEQSQLWQFTYSIQLLNEDVNTADHAHWSSMCPKLRSLQ